MSYYGVSLDMYQPPDVGTPGWNLAPVPGWGINPDRSGPPRVGIGGSIPGEDDFLPRYRAIGAEPGYEGDQYYDYTFGHVAFAGVGGMAFGVLVTYLWSLNSKGK
jgi:hypothetical protein